MKFHRKTAGLVLFIFILFSQAINADDLTSDSGMTLSASDDEVLSDGEFDATSDLTSSVVSDAASDETVLEETGDNSESGEDDTSPDIVQEETVPVKQKMVLLDLYDASGHSDYTYLKSLITDSIRLNLTLDEEGVADVVELVEREKVKDLVRREKLRGKFIWKDQAKKAAEQLDADLVATGYYTVTGEKVVVYLNIYSRKHDDYVIKLTDENVIDYTLIDKIRELSLALVQNMQEGYTARAEEEHKPRLLIFNYSLQGPDVDEYAELMGLLKRKIEKHQTYEVVARKDVVELLTLLGIVEGVPLPESLVLRIARYFGADIIITGSIAKNVGVMKISTSGLSAASGNKMLQKEFTITGRDTHDTIMEELAYYICFGEKIEPLIEGQEEEEIVALEEEEIVEEKTDKNEREQKERTKIEVSIDQKKKSGLILTAFGTSSLAFGGGLLAFDLLYMNQRVKSLKDSPSYEDEKKIYSQMVSIDTAVFISSIALMSAGSVMLVPGLILMIQNWQGKLVKSSYDRLTAAFLASGTGFLAAGTAILLFDRLGMGNLVSSAKTDNGQFLKYNEYQELYYSDVSLFALGAGFLATGGVLFASSLIRLGMRKKKQLTDPVRASEMIGYSFLLTGISSAMCGASLFIFDTTYINYKRMKFSRYDEDQDEYEEYTKYNNLNTPLFYSSIGLMGLGALFSIISIPVILAEIDRPGNKKAEIQLELGYREDLVLALSCKF